MLNSNPSFFLKKFLAVYNFVTKIFNIISKIKILKLFFLKKYIIYFNNLIVQKQNN